MKDCRKSAEEVMHVVFCDKRPAGRAFQAGLRLCFCRASLGLALFLAAPAWAASAFDSVYISEFLAENRHSLQDGDGDYPAWIELYNGGSETVDLAGWFLSDTPTNLAKWQFPGAGILPGTYLVVFASGKDHTNDLAHLHTNFRLSKNRGYLALSGPETNVVSEFGPAYPKQSVDVSYGRVRGEPDICGFFLQPTPGKPNESTGPGFAPKVVFSSDSGSFLEPFALALSCESTNVVIRYTLDGQMPSSISPVYHEPIMLTNTTCVRARIYQNGLLPGPPRSETYTLLATNVLGFKSNLPVLVMDTFGSHRATSARSSLVHLAFYEPIAGKTSLTNGPVLTTRGGFHIRGSTSAGMPQPGFAVQFLDEFNHEQHLSALGLPANSDWVLYAPTEFDLVMIHNPFVHQLSRDLGRYSPRTRFVEVYLARHAGPITAHDYFGIYVLEEKIKVGKHRVAIDRLGPDDLQPPEVTGGYLVKFDRLGPGESGFWAGGASMVYVEPKEPVIKLPQRAPQREYIKSYFDEFEHVLRGPNWKDPVQGYRAYIDVDSWIDFHVLEVLSGNVDALTYSTFFYKPRAGKITYGPHWDFDRALGSTDYRDAEPRRWNTGRFFHAPWWGRLFSDPDFWQLWVDRWQDLRRSTFSETNLFGLIDRLTDEVRDAQPREVKRWGLEPRGGTYQSEIDWMKNWLSQRIDFIDAQFVQPPRLSQAGGPVPAGFQFTLSGPDDATLYYTLDGSDPRLAQGTISSNALVYAGPITLQSDTRIVVRARNPDQHQTGGPPTSTPWSSPVRANFTVR
jgi:hypothetical protein